MSISVEKRDCVTGGHYYLVTYGSYFYSLSKEELDDLIEKSCMARYNMSFEMMYEQINDLEERAEAAEAKLADAIKAMELIYILGFVSEYGADLVEEALKKINGEKK